MQVLYQRCAGIDVHLRFLVVCLSLVEAGERRKELRRFRNETAELLALRAWWLRAGCTHVALESTGVYWLSVYRRLEGFFEVVVVHAQHIKAVPGRKTSDSADDQSKAIALCGRPWSKPPMAYVARKPIWESATDG